jgi:hypothetical protein
MLAVVTCITMWSQCPTMWSQCITMWSQCVTMWSQSKVLLVAGHAHRHEFVGIGTPVTWVTHGRQVATQDERSAGDGYAVAERHVADGNTSEACCGDWPSSHALLQQGFTPSDISAKHSCCMTNRQGNTVIRKTPMHRHTHTHTHTHTDRERESVCVRQRQREREREREREENETDRKRGQDLHTA